MQLSVGLSIPVHEQNGGFNPLTLKTILKEKYKYQKLITESHFMLDINKFTGRFLFHVHFVEQC